MKCPPPPASLWITFTKWVLQLAVAGLFLQTLFFKLTYAPQTRVIFESIGGRAAATATALAELAVALLLLIPGAWLSRTDPACDRAALEVRGWSDVGVWVGYANAVGAALALGVIGGAIATHLFIIGVDIPVALGSETTDGGSLFVLALVIAAMSVAVLWFRWHELGGLLHSIRTVLRRNDTHAATPQHP